MNQRFIGGAGITNIQADRNVSSSYGELNAPILRPSESRSGLNLLSLVVAGRYDSYSDAGSSVVPKIGMLYKPSAELEFKANWSKSFRAPDLFEEYQAQPASLGVSADPSSPSGTSIILSRAGGNRELHPETSTDMTLSATYV